jgi:hypothetical protein
LWGSRHTKIHKVDLQTREKGRAGPGQGKEATRGPAQTKHAGQHLVGGVTTPSLFQVWPVQLMSSPTLTPSKTDAEALALAALSEPGTTPESIRAFLAIVSCEAVLGNRAYATNAMAKMELAMRHLMRDPEPGAPRFVTVPCELVSCGNDIVQWVAAVLRVQGEALMTTGQKGPRRLFDEGGPDMYPWLLFPVVLHVAARLRYLGVNAPVSVDTTSLVEALAGMSRWLIGRRAISTAFHCDATLVSAIMDEISSLAWNKSREVVIEATRDALADAVFHIMEWLDVHACTQSWSVRTRASWLLHCVEELYRGVMWLSTSSARCVRRALDTARALSHLHKVARGKDTLPGTCQRLKDLLDSHEWVEDAEATAGASARVNTNESA